MFSDGVSVDEQATGDEECEIPSADFTPKTDAAAFSPITPDPKDRACRRSLTFDEKNSNLKRKARNDDSMFDEAGASDVDVLYIDYLEKDIHLVYQRRKQVQNRTPNKATHNISLPDELKGVLIYWQFINSLYIWHSFILDACDSLYSSCSLDFTQTFQRNAVGPNGEGGKEVVEPDSECNGESVEEQRKWPDSEESPLLKKIRLFMSRMDSVIGTSSM